MNQEILKFNSSSVFYYDFHRANDALRDVPDDLEVVHFHLYSQIHPYLHPFTRKFTQCTDDSRGSWKLSQFMAEADAQTCQG